MLAGYVGLMVYMGMRAMAIDTDLVREDYYQAELGHGEFGRGGGGMQVLCSPSDAGFRCAYG